MKQSTLKNWLLEEAPDALERLWRVADRVRQRHVGPEVHLRALIEISNTCIQQCTYCGLRAGERAVSRYRMSHDEILHAIDQAVSHRYGTAVLQAGEDPLLTEEWVDELLQKIKARHPQLAITLSLGERTAEELKLWFHSGADRYLLRFETSDLALYQLLHPSLSPPLSAHPRLESLEQLRTIGYEVGSGVMIGIPGQRWESLSEDLALFAQLDLDMIGVGPYIPVPNTPLAKVESALKEKREFQHNQVPNDTLTTFKVLALTRLLCPEANIPATTALGTLDPIMGRLLALQRGANVVMPNFTPQHYREKYRIYPDKAIVSEVADELSSEEQSQASHSLKQQIAHIERRIGLGRGDRLRGRRFRTDGSLRI